MQKFLEDGNIGGMYRKRVRDWSLFFRDLRSGGYGGGNGGVVASVFGFGIGDLDRGVCFNLKVNGLPGKDR